MTMKALWIAYDIVLDAQILALLKKRGVVHFTRWPRLTGSGPASGPRMDDAVWPGANAMVVTVQPDETVDALLPVLQAFRDEVSALTGIYAFTTPVLDSLR